ncbi:peptidylprolyl isomerase [filamentous cyanobacterium LEGE 11480]|uniref:peptidylprolyl isomerase n=1 Tax=Romeriopsis navalis LEGE 11480 TaxID=2777977 RepID=A0A928VM31_9CYAN|nr:peptidylprolyl isomerase [Romeriopsis navalis]MBE9031056.1 peptidylprolyl isomerase [Romeriopsis navalis LEGE 11480]
MSRSITITPNDILQQAKYTFQMPGLVAQATHRQIIFDTAEREGLIVSTEELQQTADELRVTHKLLSARDTLKWLEQHQLSVEDFEDLAYTRLIREKLKVHLCAAKVPAYFAERQLDYAQAIIYEVTVESPELAMELFYSLQEHEQDFLGIVHRYTPEPMRRLSGDYRRIVRRHDLDPEISAAVFAATPPSSIKPIKTQSGYQIVYVAEIMPPELTSTLAAQIQEELFQKWLRRQTKRQDISLAIG